MVGWWSGGGERIRYMSHGDRFMVKDKNLTSNAWSWRFWLSKRKLLNNYLLIYKYMNKNISNHHTIIKFQNFNCIYIVIYIFVFLPPQDVIINGFLGSFASSRQTHLQLSVTSSLLSPRRSPRVSLVFTSSPSTHRVTPHTSPCNYFKHNRYLIYSLRMPYSS